MTDTLSTVRVALKARSNEILGKTNVVATGVGYKVTAGQKTDTLCVVCSVEKKINAASLSADDLVPKDVDGIPTDVIETGPIRALQAPTERYRPAPGGVSLGHVDITAGTLGCWVCKDGRPMILSNNHVMANSNAAQIGDPILQPGPHDGGSLPDDQIAVLEGFVPIELTGLPSECNVAGRIADALNSIAKAMDSDTRLQTVKIHAGDNLVDAAIARPLKDEYVDMSIRHIGEIKGLAEGDIGMAIKKSGRTTDFTSGTIDQIDVTVTVQYGEGRTARFTDQLMAGPMSKGGDSGSAIFSDNNDEEKNNHLVGLLFAGSDNSTIINRIQNVFSALGLSLCGTS